MKTSSKSAKTIRPYTVKFYGGGIFPTTLTVPTGSIVSNQTAMGPDDSYRFWTDYTKTVPANSMLAHDLKHYGVNVPAEYCEPWASLVTA